MNNAHDVVRTTWREQAPRLVGGLLRTTRDLDLAEDLAHDAMVSALEQWPRTGVPDNPGAWLMTVAKRRAVDHVRSAERRDRVVQRVAQDLWSAQQELAGSAGEADLSSSVGYVEDDVLRLMFTTCHPTLTLESQVALTLRLLGGLTSREIARAFLVPEGTVVRRITRAKTTLANLARQSSDVAPSPFEVPEPTERRRRLPAVLHVLYLVFTEGYAATSGQDWLRPDLCQEAIRLATLVTDLVPDEPEAHGLVALMWLHSSRSPARTDQEGRPVLLQDQERGRWDRTAIQRGTDALGRALQGAARSGGAPRPYMLQAAIAASHARAAGVGDTDWSAIADLYDALEAVASSPVVQLNRAVAHGLAYGPETGLRLADQLADAPNMHVQHLHASVRADLLSRLGRQEEARREFERAAELTGNARERDLLLGRAHTAGTSQTLSDPVG